MRQTPLWVNSFAAKYRELSQPNYPQCLWREVAIALDALVSEDAADAWLALDKRLTKHSNEGRENFVFQICFIVACSLALPMVSPSKARKMADSTRRSVAQILSVLPQMLPMARHIHSATDMRLASVNTYIQGDRRFFNEQLFIAMLNAFVADVETWQRWNSRIAKPDHENASRLLFVRDLTEMMVAYFGTPLRSIVATMANAIFSNAPSLDAATVAKLAPLNQKRHAAGSLHALS